MQALTKRYEKLGPWLADHAGIADARVTQELAGGNANVTCRLESANGPLVLRHPPADTVSTNAGAGIAREYRFVCAIDGHAPAATPVAFSDDPTILGAPFALYEFTDGVTITEELPPGYERAAATIDMLGFAMIDALAQVHAIDPVPGDLFDPDKARAFVPRQIQRWRGERAKRSVRELTDLERLGDWLAANAPEPEVVRIVHSDFHLDNLLVDRDSPRVKAILDWEMATVADPLVDVGLATAFWNRDESEQLGFVFVQRVSNRAGVSSGKELAERWAERTGLSLDSLAYYQVFALWRLAAIVEGAFVLHRQGKVDGPYERGLEFDVPALLAQASRIAAQRDARQ